MEFVHRNWEDVFRKGKIKHGMRAPCPMFFLTSLSLFKASSGV